MRGDGGRAGGALGREPGGAVEVRQRVGGEAGSCVGVPGQFDDGQAPVSGGGERGEDGREVDLPVAERQMLVDAAAHVLDLHVPQPGSGLADAVGGREGFQALAVADVQGEAERLGVAEGAAQMVEVGEGGEEVTGFGFDGERDSGARRRVQHRPERLGEAFPGGVLVGVVGDGAAEAVHGVRPEVGGDLDRPHQQVDAARPVTGVGVEQGRAVLAPGSST